jgi:hypothetical protein
MTTRPYLAASLAVAFLAFAASPPVQPATMPAGCRLDASSTSMLHIFECQEALRIAAEAAARLAAIEQGGRLVGLRVEGGAVMVESGGRPDGFRVVTAQAVTELRQARVAVDSSGGRTSVFVSDGTASVSRGSDEVALREGEGVDVAALPQPAPPPPAPAPVGAGPPGTPPRPATKPSPSRAAAPLLGLRVVTWSRERASHLLGRLGKG